MRQPGSPIKWPLPSAGVLLLTIGVVIFGDVALATQITGEYRWVVYGLGAALAGGFHRSRVFLAVVGLGALDLVASSAPQADATGAFGSVLVLVIGLISIGRDRGVASAAGVSQILGGVVIGALPALVLFGPGNIDAFLAIEILPGGLTNWTGYPQPVVFIGILSLAAAGYGAYRWRGLVEEALLWSQL